MSDLLKCRFCGFKVMKFRKRADGKNISGWNRLTSHIENEHEAEWDTLQAALDESSREAVGS